MAETSASRLEMKGMWKSFGGVPVLREVDLRLGVGEVLALLGQNGAGKSTLVKILSGEYTKDAGRVHLDDEEVEFLTPLDAVAQGVRLLPQELSVIPDMSVMENVFIGDLPLKRNTLGARVVDRKTARDAAGESLSQLGVETDVDAPIKSLAPPEQRIVEIARALAGQARVLIMDEPTAALTEQEVKRLFETIERLKGQGVSVIYISHRLEEVFEISDRILVLRDGVNAGEFETAKASREEVLVSMIGDSVEDLYPEQTGETGEIVLEVSGLTVEGRLRDISFDIKRGEIVGAFGLIGSGLEQLGKTLFGAAKGITGGEVLLAAEPFDPRSPIEAKKAGVGYVAAERKQEGILPDMSVRENMTLAFLDRYAGRFSVSTSSEDDYVEHWMDQLSIKARDTEQRIRFLSGGNQQKVCIARWLVDGMKLLIMEEPTRGVDIGARKEIYTALKELATSGLGILLISSDAEEVAGVCDRMIVLNRGRMAGGYARGVTEKELVDVAT